MDYLRAIFPDTDSATLQAALTAHDNSLEQTVEYLLASRPTQQEQSDAALARRLQAEQDLHDVPSSDSTLSRQRAQPSSSNQTSLPSLSDISTAVQPIVAGVAHAARTAVASAQSMYNDLVQPEAQRAPVRPPDAEAIVVRGGESPRGSSTRQRRSSGGGGSAAGSKKDA